MGCSNSSAEEVNVPVLPGHTGPTSGIMILNIHEARLSREVNTISAMDPYVKVNVRMQDFKTKTDSNGGKTPKWD